jgi:hypothetical protein
MKLDKFQHFVKDGEYEPDLTVMQAQKFLNSLDGDLDEDYQAIKSDLCGFLDAGDFIDAYAVGENLESVLDRTVRAKVNACIKEALEAIEDIEADDEFEPEDCMDIDKRAKEIDQ